jgi:hypothetical protein
VILDEVQGLTKEEMMKTETMGEEKIEKQSDARRGYLGRWWKNTL